MSSRRIFWTAVLAAAIALSAQRAVGAQSPTSVTGAGGSVLASGASYKTVSLTNLKFGMGVFMAAGGTASGDFESTLLGTSAAGQPQTITVVGKPTTGSGKVGSSASLSGLCTVNMGDGTPVQSGVRVALTVASANGKWTLLMTLDSTKLPLATVYAGSVTVK
jgi:hypothetical protein